MTPCPHDLALGFSNHLHLQIKPEMSLAVLVLYECHSCYDALRSLTKQKSDRNSNGAKRNRLTSLRNEELKNTKCRASGKLVHKLPLRRLRKIKDLDGKGIPFSQDDFWKIIHKIMQEHFKLSSVSLTITPDSFLSEEQQETTFWKDYRTPSLNI